MERKPQEKIDIVSTHTLKNYPKSLEKKVTLLKHFRSYLDADKEGTGHPMSQEDLNQKKTQILSKIVYKIYIMSF